MKRQIFIVDAYVVDSNGTFSYLSGYPKKFDSVHYDNDIDKARMRACGDAAEVYGAMCKNDLRQLQMVIVSTAEGLQIDKRQIGKIADLPDPEPEPEPEPDPEPEPEE